MHRNITAHEQVFSIPSFLLHLSFLILPLLSYLSHQFDDLFLPSESIHKERYLFIFSSFCLFSISLLFYLRFFILSVFILQWSLVQWFSYILFHFTLFSILLYLPSLFTSLSFALLRSFFYTSISFLHFITAHSFILSLQIRLQNNVYSGE